MVSSAINFVCNIGTERSIFSFKCSFSIFSPAFITTLPLYLQGPSLFIHSQVSFLFTFPKLSFPSPIPPLPFLSVIFLSFLLIPCLNMKLQIFYVNSNHWLLSSSLELPYHPLLGQDTWQQSRSWLLDCH